MVDEPLLLGGPSIVLLDMVVVLFGGQVVEAGLLEGASDDIVVVLTMGDSLIHMGLVF